MIVNDELNYVGYCIEVWTPHVYSFLRRVEAIFYIHYSNIKNELEQC